MTRRARNAGATSAISSLFGAMTLLMGTLAAGSAAAADLQLRHADPGVVRMAAPPGARAGEIQLRVDTPAGLHRLRLRRHEALGAVARDEAGAEAFTGEVEGRPGSWVAVTRIGARWSGLWFDGTEFFGIETAGELAPVQQKLFTGAAGTPMVFRLSDVQFDDASFEGDVLHAPPGNGQALVEALAGDAPAMAAAIAAPTHRLKLAIVADSILARAEGDQLEANLLAKLNIIDGLFSNQVGVEVTADSVTTFTTRSSDPFTNTDEPGALLDQLSSWRAGNAWQRNTALTHLFTGRDLERRTVGLAYLDTLCSRRYSASLSEARGPASFAALIAAHEIAHVFGAPHDGEAGGACATTNDSNYLMAPRINGSQQFSACSLAQMAPRVQAASCLQKLETTAVETPATPGTGGGSSSGGGGGGALAGTALALLGLMGLARARRRLQMRENQSAR